MSTSNDEPADDEATAGTFPAEFIPDYEPPSTPTVRVTVDGTVVPVAGDCVRTEIRREGLDDSTVVSDVMIRAEYDDIPYYKLPFTSSDSGYRKATVSFPFDTRDGNTLSPVVQGGFVKAYGGSEENGAVTFRVNDPSQLLDEIPASVSFADATVADVFTYVLDELRANQSVYDTVELATRGGVGDESVVENIDGSFDRRNAVAVEALEVADRFDPTSLVDEIIPDNNVEALKKTFTANRHTLLDVVKWVRDRVNVRFDFQYIDPALYGIDDLRVSEAGLYVIVWPPDDPATRTDYEADRVYDGPTETSTSNLPDEPAPVDVIQNTALYDIQPRNAVTVRGEAVRTSTGGSSIRVNPTAAQKKYLEVTAGYPPLIDRAGEVYAGSPVNVDARYGGEVRNAAKSLVVDRLAGTSSGEIVTTLDPRLRPYDTITAVPVEGSVAAEVDPLTWDIDRVVHETDADKFPHTRLGVSPVVRPEDIEILDVTWREA